MFSGQNIPSCGFSLGLERIILLMEEQAMFPAQLAGQPQVLVTQFDKSTDAQVSNWRSNCVGPVAASIYTQKTERYGKQFKYADERRIRYTPR